jgi:hypothetical protein
MMAAPTNIMKKRLKQAESGSSQKTSSSFKKQRSNNLMSAAG